jgi:predicted CXXCH cytochrome family protein
VARRPAGAAGAGRLRGAAALGLLLLLLPFAPGAARAAIVDTVHNLSATGPGQVRGRGTTELCVFCHVPHRAATTRALWNRDLPPVTYRLYGSSTLDAAPQQPNGASRLCLSCHDGTTALGLLRVPPRAGRPALGPLTGRAALGTDLSDDHPISFEYTRALGQSHGDLADPTGLPPGVPLDGTRQVQCTTCHDPHENRFRAFLRIDDQGGALCTACHTLRNWPGSSHATSTKEWNGRGVDPWPTSPYPTVADNACASCHRPHAAARPARLLARTPEADVCLVCHDANLASRNVEAALAKASAHPVASTDGVHDPREDERTMPRHVTCVDCHNPHQATGERAAPPALPGPLRGVPGLTQAGRQVDEAASEAEVCYRCHGVRDQGTRGLVRQDNLRNVRLELDPGNASFHPVAARGRHPGASGFLAGYTAASRVTCSDCHGEDATGPDRPRGPHGSRFAPILERQFRTTDPSVEAPDAYALCYKCHSREALLANQVGKFPHQAHVVRAQASCAVCHDAHGSRRNPRLINFMLRDPGGRPVVLPSQNQGRLEYETPRPGGGPGTGRCFLSCHGLNHEPFGYG